MVRLHSFVPASPTGDQLQILLERAALSEALMDGLDIGIMTCDEHGRLSLLNRVGRDLHGVDVGDTIEPGAMADTFTVYHADGRRLLAAEELPLLRALHGERVDGQEVVIAPPGRPRRLVTCTGRQILHPDGSLLGAVVGLRDVTSQRAIEAALSARAEHDPLTGLPNRVLLDQRTGLSLAAAVEHPRSVALLFVDLDGFAAVNDIHGRDAGDKVLRQAARRLDDIVRSTDTTARLGSDSFVVMCPDMPAGDASHAERLAKRIRSELGRPFHTAGATVALSTSIGIAYNDGDRLDAEDLVARADAAMLSAKQQGRGRIATFSDETIAIPRHSSPPTADIERLLRAALEDDTLAVHYQPVLALDVNQVVGVEALARLSDDAGEPLLPDRFVAVAEQCGLVGAIGERVLRRATEQVAGWKRQLPPSREFGLGVNLSVRQLGDPDLLGSVERALADSGLDSDALVFELTESVFSDCDQHASVLRGLRQLGPKLAIDDFGTGYSSLSYLRRFDVDILKIDRSFVADLAHERGRQVTGAIVAMAHAVGALVIAEGIETPHQLAVLRSMGCPLGQGNLLAPAQSADSITAMLADETR
ncbi:hypothetical protein BH20ACT6_BH20ACT6_21850 [soil metagenome]